MSSCSINVKLGYTVLLSFPIKVQLGYTVLFRCPIKVCISVSVVDPNTMNLDPDPGFWTNLDPDPGTGTDQGLNCKFLDKKF